MCLLSLEEAPREPYTLVNSTSGSRLVTIKIQRIRKAAKARGKTRKTIERDGRYAALLVATSFVFCSHHKLQIFSFLVIMNDQSRNLSSVVSCHF